MFRIAPIAESHIEGFRAALDGVSRERRYLLFLEAPSANDVRGFVTSNIRKRYPQFVALAADAVVGWCDVLPVDRRPIRSHVGTLGLAVKAEFRGQGIGSALLRTTIEGARAFGFTRVELTYRSGNARVATLYERHGFVREGVQRNGVRVDGAYEDLVGMALILG